MKFKLSDEVQETFHAAAKVKTPFEVSSKGKAKDSGCFITAEDLKPSGPGKSNILRFMNSMAKDFDSLHYGLIDEDGMVKLKKHVHSKETMSVSWFELVARVPGFLVQRYKELKTKKEKGLGSQLGWTWLNMKRRSDIKIESEFSWFFQIFPFERWMIFIAFIGH